VDIECFNTKHLRFLSQAKNFLGIKLRKQSTT
jgi:hypothetical protein